MDIYEYLKADHKKVSDLFKQFEKSESNDRRLQIVAMLAEELIIHTRSEQETFYKILLEHKQSKDDAVHGKEEHQEIETCISKVLAHKKYSANFEKDVKELKKIVDHHVKEEEGEIFDKAKKVLSPEKAYAIKEQMHYLKHRMKERLI